jgi:hypothetical protein
MLLVDIEIFNGCLCSEQQQQFADEISTIFILANKRLANPHRD